MRWDAAAQLVAVEVEPLQVGEVAQFRRDAAAELVAVEIEVRQTGEVAQFGGNAAAQLVAIQAEPRYMPCSAPRAIPSICFF